LYQRGEGFRIPALLTVAFILVGLGAVLIIFYQALRY
jgi:hypothetical protein